MVEEKYQRVVQNDPDAVFEELSWEEVKGFKTINELETLLKPPEYDESHSGHKRKWLKKQIKSGDEERQKPPTFWTVCKVPPGTTSIKLSELQRMVVWQMEPASTRPYERTFIPYLMSSKLDIKSPSPKTSRKRSRRSLYLSAIQWPIPDPPKTPEIPVIPCSIRHVPIDWTLKI